MTTRRTFLASLMGVIASVALAQRVVLDTLRIAAPLDTEINPAWVNAEFEETFVGNPVKWRWINPASYSPKRWIFVHDHYEEVPKYAVLLTDPKA